MSQTVKGQNDPAQKSTVQKAGRPGQRQQQRIQRRIRRKRRRTIGLAILASVVFLVIVGVSFWQIQQFMARQAQAQKPQQAQKVQKPACASEASSIYSGVATPSAGPTSPPNVTCTPVTTADGLQYVDITVGNGPVVSSGSSVSVQYVGWLASNGKKFDSSYDRPGPPFQVTVGQGSVIKGWDKGLVGMKQGGTRRLIIPAALGYGAAGQGPIPANATLIFDITVVSVQ